MTVYTGLLLVAVIAVMVFRSGPLAAQLPVAEIAYDSASNFLQLPQHLYFGEVAGVATNARGNVFVYNRPGRKSRLFEFDRTGKFVREIGQGLYGFFVAHSVRVDPQNNVWVVDEAANMVIKFNPEGRMAMTLGRRPETIPVAVVGSGAGTATDSFNRPTDVAFDSAGNIFVSDGHGNSRVAKFDSKGVFLKSWGSKGAGPGQFDVPHSIATDAQGNLYVGDVGNRRIQVFDNNGQFKTEYRNVGAPAAICISPGSPQYLFSSHSNSSDSMDNGEIYKMTLDGRVVGKFGKAGKLVKEFGSVHSIDCRNPNELYVGELTNWRVQKVTLRGN